MVSSSNIFATAPSYKSMRGLSCRGHPGPYADQKFWDAKDFKEHNSLHGVCSSGSDHVVAVQVTGENMSGIQTCSKT